MKTMFCAVYSLQLRVFLLVHVSIDLCVNHFTAKIPLKFKQDFKIIPQLQRFIAFSQDQQVVDVEAKDGHLL
jgi:hypothetical protein